MKDFYQCTCGFDTTDEAKAIRHVATFHTTDEQKSNAELLKDRIRVMISSLYRPLSFDQIQ